MRIIPPTISSSVLFQGPTARQSILLAATFLTLIMPTSPVHAACDPNGVANEVIGCIDTDNAATKARLAKFYSRYLNSFATQCQAENPGGGSGGHLDRATCLQKRLKQEALRVGIPAN
jgi:hypothetical protein